MKLIDLTHPLRLGTVGYPGSARLVGWPMKEIVFTDYNMLHLSTDLHTGTHLDAMLHCMPDGCDTAGLPLEHCVGSAAVVDVRAKGKKGDQFEAEDFYARAEDIRRCGKVILKTGWARTWDTPDYHDNFPGFSASAADYLVALGIHLVALEQASVHPVSHLEIHRIFFRRNIIIVEGLANVTSVTADIVDFFAAPLRLEGGDGSLLRAFCRY